jgi:DUF2075 family protein/Mrp family chromosome partitioning ATPase
VARAEVRSWKESLLAVAKVVNDGTIPDECGVGIEYGIPQTSKRIDFLLSGQGATGGKELVIIELKQWQSAKKTQKDGVVSTRFEHGEAEVSHPSYQAWSYASLLRDFNEAVYEPETALRPCAYLHNYEDDGVLTDRFYAEYVEKAPIFQKGEEERQNLRKFIRQHVKRGDRGSLLHQIENGRIRPSKGLMDALSGMLAGKPEFVLIDDQKVVYETALAAAEEAAATGRKKVVIVEGGPGTGKSVVAINLLVALTARGLVAKYVTKNAAPRAVFESKLAGTYKKSRISNLFVGSGAFTETGANVFDALVVDEAHRLNEKSGLYGNLGTNQIVEIIGAAKCAIFFIDEDQRVTWKDIGEIKEIERIAQQALLPPLKLASQFRCGGSDGYLAWLDATLGIHETANQVLDVQGFDFLVFDSPEELRKVIAQKNEERNAARMVAGYCWDWTSKKDAQMPDVVISEYGFGMRWNLDKERNLWMVAPDSVEQIGCIHTCQGLEVDYIGVIVGPDLAARGGKVVARPERRSKHDKSLNGYHKLMKTDAKAARTKADLIIKNTYRTLMTRGMKGCYVYFVDKALDQFVRSRVGLTSADAPVRKVAEPGPEYRGGNDESADLD